MSKAAVLTTAEEVIAYGIPCFKVDGKRVAGLVRTRLAEIAETGR